MHVMLHIAWTILHTGLPLKMISPVVKPANTQALRLIESLCHLKLCLSHDKNRKLPSSMTGTS